MAKDLIYDRRSDCCNAPMRILPEGVELPAEQKKLFYFSCAACNKPCHMKKKIRH